MSQKKEREGENTKNEGSFSGDIFILRGNRILCTRGKRNSSNEKREREGERRRERERERGSPSSIKANDCVLSVSKSGFFYSSPPFLRTVFRSFLLFFFSFSVVFSSLAGDLSVVVLFFFFFSCLVGVAVPLIVQCVQWNRKLVIKPRSI